MLFFWIWKMHINFSFKQWNAFKNRHVHIQKSTAWLFEKHRHKVRSTHWFNFCHCKCPSGFKFLSALSSCNMTYKPVKQPELKRLRKGFCCVYSSYWTLAHAALFYLSSQNLSMCTLFHFHKYCIVFSIYLWPYFFIPLFPPDILSFHFYFLLFLSIIHHTVMDSRGQGCDAVNSRVTQILILLGYSAVL